MERKTGNTAKSQAPGILGENSLGVNRTAPRFSTEQLLKSRALSGFQPDFARAVLTGPEYTVEEALDALNKFFKGGGK